MAGFLKEVELLHQYSDEPQSSVYFLKDKMLDIHFKKKYENLEQLELHPCDIKFK